MDVGRPYASVIPSLEGDVLTTLWGTRGALTGRELARLVKRGSQAGVHRALQRLVAQGVVRAERAGSAVLFSLNRDHLAAEAIELLSGLRSELEARLRTEIASWSVRPHHVSLFGSAARGDGDEDSDLDLFVVRPSQVAEDDVVWRKQLAQLAERARQWTGNEVSFSEVSRAELRALRRTQPKIVSELMRDAIDLYGDSPAVLLKKIP